MRAAAFLLLALLVAAGGAGAETREERDARLGALKAELEARRAAVKDLDDKAKSLVESLGALDESLDRLAQEAEKAAVEEKRLRAEADALAAEHAAAKQAFEAVEARLQRRMRALFVLGEGGALRALVGAEGFEELALRRRYLEELAESDAKLVGDYRAAYQATRARKEKLDLAASAAAKAKADLDEEKALLALTKQERELAIARVRTERDLAQRQAQEMLLRHTDLAVLMFRLEEEANRRDHRAKGGGILRGGLPWPVEGGVVIQRFGSILDKETRAEIVSNGVHIRAEAGAPVRAVGAGTVAHVGWLRGFGRIVIVDHGEGHHTLSAHLGKALVQKGDRVEKGQAIALVGDTESTNGPKLYFELREGGKPKDPAPYLGRFRDR